MTKTRSRIISIFLATLMLLSCFCVTAFAAVTLTKDNVKQLPTVTRLVEGDEIPYGITYGELYQINDDEIVQTASGTQVAGHFQHVLSKASPSPKTTGLAIKFYPDNTTAYSTFTYTKAIPLDVKIVTGTLSPVDPDNAFPTAEPAEFGTSLADVELTNPKYQNEPYKKAVTLYWDWDDPTQVVTESGYYSANLSSPNYETVTAKVWVEVKKSETFTGIVEAPTAVLDESTFNEKTTLADVALVGGKAQYEGKDIAGHFEWTDNRNLVDYLGRSMAFDVKFVPDDASLADIFNVQDKFGLATVVVPAAKKIELADGVTEISMKYTYSTSNTAYSFGLMEFKNGLDPRTVSVSIDSSYKNKPVGTYENVPVTFSSSNKLYAKTTVNMTLKVLPKPVEKDFGTVGMFCSQIWNEANPADLYKLSYAFSSEGLNGTATLKVNGEVIAEVGATYSGSSASYGYKDYTVPKDGKYVVSLEYHPTDTDNYAYTTNYVEKSYDIVLNIKRNITVVGGTADTDAALAGTAVTAKIDGKTVTEKNFNKWIVTDAAGEVLPASALGVTDADLAKPELKFTMPAADIKLTAQANRAITAAGCIVEPANAVAGTVITAKIDGDKVTEENFEKWVITDADGNEIPAADLGLSEEDLTKTEISFTMPDEDIKLTAKTNKTSCWENIKNFFGKVAQLPVISWIVAAVKFIVNIFVKVFKWMFSCIIK